MKAGFALRTWILVAGLSLGWLGCGSTPQREASEQLLTCDAVDRSIAQIDFRALSGETVYFDTTYLKNVKGVGFVNAEYITSALRQQLVAARCLLKDNKAEAEYVVEARIGVLGMDRHEITYGMPANNFLSAASSLVPNSPPLPTLPELSLAKRNEQLAAAKIAAFAYHRETGEPVWQSGLSPIRSTSKDIWILGAGPFQRGSIHKGTRFAGAKLGFSSAEDAPPVPLVDYHKPAYFSPRLAVRTAENEPETKPEAAPEAVAPQPPEPKPEPKPAPPPEPKPAETKPAEPPAAEQAPEPPAVAESKPEPPAPTPTENPLKSALPLESGLRLRIHFHKPSPADLESDPKADAKLFRLDPVE